MQTLLSTYPNSLPKKGILTKKTAIGKGNGRHPVWMAYCQEIPRLGIRRYKYQKKVIVAVEALEGTDEAIRRGGNLGKRDLVVIKVSNMILTHDLIFLV